jgi:hypothetical protein
MFWDCQSNAVSILGFNKGEGGCDTKVGLFGGEEGVISV